MTSKEKAEELAMKYDNHGETDNAVRCAIIAVDEILELYEQDIYFWQEVKQHLEEML